MAGRGLGAAHRGTAARTARGRAVLHAQRHGDVVAGAKGALFSAGQDLAHQGMAEAVLTRPLGNADALVRQPGAGLFMGSECFHGAKWV